MLRQMKRRTQRGIGLLELMLSLAIVAMLLLLATRYYGSTQRSNYVNQGINLVQTVFAAAASYSAGHNGTVSGINTAAIAGSGYLPAQFVSGSTINTPWPGATMAIAAVGTGSDMSVAANMQYTVTISNLPDYACTNLASKFVSVSVGGNTSTCTSGTFTAKFSVSDADTA